MLQSIRKCFDLRNSSLVNYLEASVDMVNSIQSGRRSPNPRQLQGILKLQKALAWETETKELAYANSFLKTEIALARPLLQDARIKLARQISRKKAQLTKLQSNRDAWLRGLHASHHLINTDPNLSTHQRKWVVLRKKHLEMRLKEPGLFSEKILEAEIKGLEERFAWLKNL